jgi:hypothetical protein
MRLPRVECGMLSIARFHVTHCKYLINYCPQDDVASQTPSSTLEQLDSLKTCDSIFCLCK